MNTARIAALLSGLVVSGSALAQIETAPPLPLDQPRTMRDMEAVCTGIGSDAREDPRWAVYPLKVEVAGRLGQFLGEAEVTITKGTEAVVTVRCAGPWILFKLSPGTYGVTAEVEGTSKSGKVTVGAKGQARIVLRFPNQGGAVSPEYVPKG
jgi:hypothetical protein